jgi:hypothetical protein
LSCTFGVPDESGARQREAAKEAVKAWADAGGQMPDTPMRASDAPARVPNRGYGSRQRTGETSHEMLDRLLTELQETGACRVATLSVAEIVCLVETLGLYTDECFIDVAGWLYVQRREADRG